MAWDHFFFVFSRSGSLVSGTMLQNVLKNLVVNVWVQVDFCNVAQSF